MTRVTVRFLAIALPLGIAACSTSSSYPSLAYRDVERVSGTATPAPDETATTAQILPPVSGDLRTRLSTLLKSSQESNRQFQSNLAAAQRAVSSAGSRGSDSWSAASVALARLESSRSSTMGNLAQLDVLYAEARETAPDTESPSTTAISETRNQVGSFVSSQDQTLAALSRRMGT